MSLLKSSRHHRRDIVKLSAWDREMQQLYLRRWQIFVLQIGRPIDDHVGADGRSGTCKCASGQPVPRQIAISRYDAESPVQKVGDGDPSPFGGQTNAGLVAMSLNRLCRCLWIKVYRNGAIQTNCPRPLKALSELPRELGGARERAGALL